jgi:hypothetical protein
MTPELARRLAVIITLVRMAPGQRLGRTAIMKLLYFLSSLRNVDLGYRFSLYAYGPFDSEVLQDLEYATSIGALSSRVVGYPNGYGYEIEPGPAAESALEFDGRFARRHQSDFDWIMEGFGRRSAAELELMSTIIYADRELATPSTPEALAKVVVDIKPHFTIGKIRKTVDELRARNIVLVGS